MFYFRGGQFSCGGWCGLSVGNGVVFCAFLVYHTFGSFYAVLNWVSVLSCSCVGLGWIVWCEYFVLLLVVFAGYLLLLYYV